MINKCAGQKIYYVTYRSKFVRGSSREEKSQASVNASGGCGGMKNVYISLRRQLLRPVVKVKGSGSVYSMYSVQTITKESGLRNYNL
jgi:hypothetical protein